MIDIVIIGQNEGPSIDSIINSIPSDHHIIYVADRCVDDTIQKLYKYHNVSVIDTTTLNLSGRQTSLCRNLGLHFTSPNNDVLFLDGDRYITQGDFNSLYNTNTDIQLLLLENDFRTDPRFDLDYAYGTMYNGFFSCGVLFKRNAINIITNHNLLKRNDSFPQLFPEELQYEWGIEDTSLGDICYDCGLSISLNDSIRLKGQFNKMLVDSIDTIEKRLRFRDKLKNVKW